MGLFDDDEPKKKRKKKPKEPDNRLTFDEWTARAKKIIDLFMLQEEKENAKKASEKVDA